MIYFFSTGEASGESSAVALAQAIRRIDPDASFEGIGAQRMRAGGVTLWRDHTGWASMGPLAAIPRIPKLLVTMWRTALHVAARKPDAVVLVDFGVFNLRLAKTLRRIGYTGAIVDLFPPGAWLDSERTARAVRAVAVPVTAFAHQAAFYRDLGLAIEYFGHPLAGEYGMRPLRASAPPDGGTVAILPGSRSGELRRHLPLLAQAFALLRERRPRLRAVFGAADERGAAEIARVVRVHGMDACARVERGVAAAVAQADGAWSASGTAVLECALCGVPAVALYVISPVLVKHGRTMIKHRFITLPNLVLERGVVPELLQEEATPRRLADEMDGVLRDPGRQYAAFAALRDALGPPDALDSIAQFVVSLARGATEGAPA